MTTMWRRLLALGALLFVNTKVSKAYEWTDPQEICNLAGHSSPFIYDVDGDGVGDVVVGYNSGTSTTNPAKIYVFFGQGDGTFQEDDANNPFIGIPDIPKDATPYIIELLDSVGPILFLGSSRASPGEPATINMYSPDGFGGYELTNALNPFDDFLSGKEPDAAHLNFYKVGPHVFGVLAALYTPPGPKFTTVSVFQVTQDASGLVSASLQSTFNVDGLEDAMYCFSDDFPGNAIIADKPGNMYYAEPYTLTDTGNMIDVDDPANPIYELGQSQEMSAGQFYTCTFGALDASGPPDDFCWGESNGKVYCAFAVTPSPTDSPTLSPSKSPTDSPTVSPSKSPTDSPTLSPTLSPSKSPTDSPTLSPTQSPSKSPTDSPTVSPSKSPTDSPTLSPSKSPTTSPTLSPTLSPSKSPTDSPTLSPSKSPTDSPTLSPSKSPTTSPTLSPTKSPTTSPTLSPTKSPTTSPTLSPTKSPTTTPTKSPTTSPTLSPTNSPTTSPTRAPTPFSNCTGCDLLVSLDQSFSIRSSEFEREKEVLQLLLDYLPLGPDGVGVAMTSFGLTYVDYIPVANINSQGADGGRNEANVVNTLNTFIADATGRIRFTNFIPLFDSDHGIALAEASERPTILLLSDGEPYTPRYRGRRKSTVLACKEAKDYKLNYPQTRILCFQSDLKSKAKAFYKCACDAVWLASGRKGDEYNPARVALEIMQNLICRPTSQQTDPCAPINDDDEIVGKGNKRRACLQVRRDSRGMEVDPESVLDLPFKPQRQCMWRRGKCVVLAKYAPLYDSYLPPGAA